METVDLMIRSATVFYADLRKDENGRYRSWEHCYKCFHDARDKSHVDLDNLSLQLAFYLASWGMYRGSSFLLQKDYKIHMPVVEKILGKEYDCLFGIEVLNLRRREVQLALEALEKFISSYYGNIRTNVRQSDIKSKISTTLLTKILMGTLGCVPAYDRYFIDGIKDQKVSTGNYNMQSILKLVDFYEKHYEALEEARNQLTVYDLKYPQMKLLDMGFWQIGFERDMERKKNRR